MNEITENKNDCDDVFSEIEELIDKPADFETAIKATGFGKFNFYLVLLAIPASWTTLFQTTTMSYVFPAAECDLNLSLQDKGMLNSATYAGTIISALCWGFLFDTYGRRKLLMIGYFLDAVCVILSAFSPDKYFLMAMKFLGGFIINGPFAAIPTYLSELHVAKYRTRVPMLLGIGFSLGGIYLPTLAAFIFPLNIKIHITDFLVFYSWGLYLILNALPSLLCSLIFMFLPESPKYLMSMGKNEEAMLVFRKIYSVNTGNEPDSFPIKRLIQEAAKETESSDEPKSFLRKIRGGWHQMKPLFRSPYLRIIILVCGLNAFIFTSLSTLRLWTPQIFQAFNDYKFLNNGTSSSLCEMLDVIRPKNQSKSEECFVNMNNTEVYVRSAIVSTTGLMSYLIASSIINCIGPRRFLRIITFLYVCVASSIYFSPNEEVATALLSLFKSLGSITLNVTIVVTVNLFPTTVRTMAVALAMMSGRTVGVLGNMIFPILLKMGCAPPFFTIAGQVFACFLLSLLVPKQNNTLT